MFVDENLIEAPVEPAGASITRYDLDLGLFRAAASANVDARMGTTVDDVRRHNGDFDVVTSEGVCRARAVINASGRWSNLKRRPGLNGPRWIGIKAHYREAAPPDSVDLYFFDGGYCGVQALGPDTINACAMVRADVGTTLDAVFAQHEHLAQRSRGWEPLIPQVSTAPLLFHRPLLSEDGVVNAGDAAGFVDPFVGDGISIALHSGAMAADSLRSYWRGEAPLAQALDRYGELYRQNLRPVFRRAALLRWILSLPRTVRAPMLNIMRSSRVARMVVERTRAL
jgi:flavin-dependent dehydrogenase